MTKINFNLIIFILIFILFFKLFLLVAIEKTPEIILLSFDTEVPDNVSVMNDLLDLLKEHNSSSTFFVTVDFVEKNPLITNRIVDEGHELACHTRTHPHLNDVNESVLFDEIEGCRLYLTNEYDIEVKGFRAPYREVNEATFEALKKYGFKYDASLFTFWSFLYPKPSIEEIYTSQFLGFPLDDYVLLKILHLPPNLYFWFLDHDEEYRSYSFHPKVTMEHKDSFENFLVNLKINTSTHAEVYDAR